jgi:pimeloyl-ACP methyl ester carboxylesterase
MTRLSMTYIAVAMATAIAASSGTAFAAVKAIVLVHGALADGSGWRAVYDILKHDGYSVSIVQEPLTSLADDVAATKRVLERQSEPVVLVGHSYGGTVISVAGTDPKVKALVYVAALQPDAGESTGQLVASMKAVSDDIKPTSDKFLFLDPAKFPADFAADLPKDVAEFMAISQAPVSAEAFSAKLPDVAWHDKPSYGIVATQDKALNPDLERWMYKRSGAKVTEVQASHAVYMSQPAAVAKVIEDAARSVQ